MDELANITQFALTNLVAAHQHCWRLGGEVSGIAAARRVALERLIECAHGSIHALAEAFRASSPFARQPLGADGAVDVVTVLDAALAQVEPELPPGTRLTRGYVPVLPVRGDPVQLAGSF